MKKAYFHFSLELYPFLQPSRRRSTFEYSFNGPQTVKHLVEAAGVPHTEVSSLRINGDLAAFEAQVQEADRVEVFSYLSEQAYSSIELSLAASDLNGRSNPRFILDNHLGKLASYLRMLGINSLYRNSFQDDELAQLSAEESRILLTRDHRLLMRKAVTQGYWLRSQDPDHQLKEVVKRYALSSLVKPFQRCMRCNELLDSVSKETILHRLQPLTIQYFDDFRLCPACGQIYWQGSHYTKMLAFIETTLDSIQ